MTGTRDRSEGYWPAPRLRGDEPRGRSFIRAQRHGEDLARLFRAPHGRWTDALASEARAQISGCLNAMELAIGIGIAPPAIANIVSQLGPNHCRNMLEAEPQLLGAAVLDHFRVRAALALAARGAFGQQVPPELDSEAGAAGLYDSADTSDDLVMLNLAEAKWLSPPVLNLPIRPDLPAEIYADLAWCACTLLLQGYERQLGDFSRDATEALAEATARMIARHDESVGAFALAVRCARAVPQGERRQIALLALRERRLLLFCALAAQELHLSLAVTLAALLDDVQHGRVALLKAMGVHEEIALRAQQALAFADGRVLNDEGAAAFVDHYRAVPIDEVEAVIARISGPEPLAERLAMIERVRP